MYYYYYHHGLVNGAIDQYINILLSMKKTEKIALIGNFGIVRLITFYHVPKYVTISRKKR